MKRIAAPMVGGLATSFGLELLVYPAVFAFWKRRTLPYALAPQQGGAERAFEIGPLGSSFWPSRSG